MAIRHGYFPIDQYEFPGVTGNETHGQVVFEETLRVHTKSGKVWSFRPIDKEAMGFWAVTEDEIQWTLYHLPQHVYVLERGEDLASETEQLPSGAKIHRLLIKAEQPSPLEAAEWLVKWDYALPSELKYLEKEIVAKASPTISQSPPYKKAWCEKRLLRLPDNWAFAVGQVKGQGIVDPDVRDQIIALTKLGSALLSPALTLSDATTPISAGHALVIFLPALDALATYLTEQFGSSTEEFKGEVRPPCNYPMRAQTAIMRLAEKVRVMQEWDARQLGGALINILPADLVTSFERVLYDLKDVLQTAGPSFNAPTAEPAEGGASQKADWEGRLYNPADEDYRLLSKLQAENEERFPTIKDARVFLDTHPEIRSRRPKTKQGKEHPQRIEVHYGDWHACLKRETPSCLPDPADISAPEADALLEIAKRKEAERRRKSKGREDLD